MTVRRRARGIDEGQSSFKDGSDLRSATRLRSKGQRHNLMPLDPLISTWREEQKKIEFVEVLVDLRA